MPPRRLFPALLALLAAVLFVAPAALASPASTMLQQINAARASQGLRAVHLYRPLNRSSKSYAAYLARRGVMVHASNPARGAHVGYVGEILGSTTGTDSAPAAILQAWLASPVHRPILLDGRYRYVGIGVRHGSAGWIWVVRFGAR